MAGRSKAKEARSQVRVGDWVRRTRGLEPPSNGTVEQG